MRILHTSDWHIGKRLQNGKDRLQEQAEFLDELLRICEDERIELVLVAGDVFDTYTPGAEGEELFFAKIKKLAGGTRAVLLISGNHDDGVRLSAISPLAEEQGVYVVGNARTPVRVGKGERLIYPSRSGKGYVVFQNDKGEETYVATLPYPNEARFKEEKSDLPYVERIQGWMDECMAGNTTGLPSVFVGHLFVAGGVVSDSERDIDLGGARAVPATALPSCDYIALGHLHKKQRMGKNCFYSGSPLQYSFDESADKGVKVFDLTKDGVQNLKDVPFTKGKKLIRLTAENVDVADTLLKANTNAWVELTLILSAPLTASDSKRLAANDNLVALKTEVRMEGEMTFESRKGLSDEQLFNAFYESNFQTQPSEELKGLFLQTLNELREK